jgi:hypothetical protein
LALVQMIVRFRLFLHINLSRSSRDNLWFILFSALLIALMASGTLVILFNLRQRTMQRFGDLQDSLPDRHSADSPHAARANLASLWAIRVSRAADAMTALHIFEVGGLSESQLAGAVPTPVILRRDETDRSGRRSVCNRWIGFDPAGAARGHRAV